MKKKSRFIFTALSLALLLVPALAMARAATSVPTFRANMSYIDLGAPTSLQIADNMPLTVEAWVRVEYHREDVGIICKNNGRATSLTAANNSYLFWLRGNGSRLSAYTGSSWCEVTLPAPIERGTWHHVAFSFDGTEMTFVYDGVEVGKKAYTFKNTVSHTLKIGGQANSRDLWGSIADVRIWDQARTPLQIKGDMNRRLTGAELGLRGYWPLNEGTGIEIFDRTAHANKGTWVGITDWAPTDSLDLAAFTLAHPITGSTRFTGTNEVAIARLSIPGDSDQYQITLSGEPSAINPSEWVSTNTPLGLVQFDRPAADANITVYAWYTNSTDVAYTVKRDAASIFYTSAEPTASIRATVTREQPPQGPVEIPGEILNNGSTGGQANGTELGIYSWTAMAVEPSDDSTPDEDYATLPGTGTYPLKLQLMNEAGNTVISDAASALTVAVYSGENVWTGDGLTDLWSNGGNWRAGLPLEGQNVAIRLTGATVQVDGPTPGLASFSLTAGTLVFNNWDSQLAATDVQITGGTVTTSSAFLDYEMSNRVWIAAVNNVSLTSPGKIDVSGKGYRSMMGPGTAPSIGDGYGGGGGHGGRGGFASVGGGSTYDSLIAPTIAGSGGAYGSQHAGGNGGGVVRIEVGGTLSVNGIIAANGVNGAQNGGGGAGGSIHITAAQFTGNATGLLQVNGGNEMWGLWGAGGGGGRIAVAGGGVDVSMKVKFSASPGTSHYQLNHAKVFTDTGIPNILEPFQAWLPQWGTLYIGDNGFVAVLPAENQLTDVILHIGTVTEWETPALTLTKNRFRLAPEGFTLKVANDLAIGGTAHLGVEGSIVVGNDLLLADTGRLSIYAGPTNGTDLAHGAVVTVTNDIMISGSAWLQPVSHLTNGGSVLLRMRDLIIAGPTNGINATGRGFAGNWGPGRASGTSRNGYNGGGGYGGSGSKGSYGVGGVTYGNPYAPLLPGSGGSGGVDFAPFSEVSGYGGGLIRVDAQRNIQLDGQIVADGCAGIGAYRYTGGGSGGGILISCNRFLGSETALLSARGGNGGASGGGGGGRIAVWHKRMPTHLQAKLLTGITGTAITSMTNPADYLGQVNVGGGTGSTPVAQPGSIWFIMPPPPGAMVLVR